MEQQSFCGCW